LHSTLTNSFLEQRNWHWPQLPMPTHGSYKHLAHGIVLRAFLFIRHPWRLAAVVCHLPSLTSSSTLAPRESLEFHGLRREAKQAIAADQRKVLPCVRATASSASFVASCRSHMMRQSKRSASSHGSIEPGTIAAGSPLFYVLMIA
jgi:hypothetical protein